MVASVAREDCMFAIGHVLHETYRIERLLGQGGMASVFEVAHARLPRRFALKIITAHDAQSAEYMMRFRREAEILASLDHPNLVNVVDWNITPAGQPYLVMEFLSGEDLAHLLHRTGALPLKVALSIFAQAAAALEVAHSHGITHRDLKPANIFLCKNGLVPHYTKVLDFGIAKSARHSQALVTDHLVLMGTPAYMAPEQARGDPGGVDARSDQFSLAIVLYEMLAGKSAFYRRGEPAMTTLCRILTEDPPPLPDAPMNQAVMRALRKEPEERYPSLAEMVAAVMSASSVPLELIEIPERTDPIMLRKLGNAGAAAAPAPRQLPPVAVAPADTPGSSFAPDGHVSLTTVPTEGAPSYPPPSLLSDRSGEVLRRDRPRRPLLQYVLIGSALVSVGTGLFVVTHSPRFQQSAASPQLRVEGADMTESIEITPEDLPPPQDFAQAVDLASPPPPPRSHPRYALGLSGLSEKSTVGQCVLRCLKRTLYQSDLRKLARSQLWLGRAPDGNLKVVSDKLSGEQSNQVEQCLYGLDSVVPFIPSRIDITIVEEKTHG